MNWLVMLVLSFVVPIVQPMVQQGVSNVQARVQQRMQQPAPQVQTSQPQYYYDGKDWYCFHNGQWWIWKPNN